MRQAFTIVFNGAHTLEQCVENALPLLDRWVIVEGCVPWLAHLAKDGASTDGTIEILARLQARHPAKLVVLHGLWPDKLAMCNAAVAQLQPEGLLWQIDCDEFYHRAAMEWVMSYMESRPCLFAAEFWAYHFYGGFEWHTALKPGFWGNDPPWRRLWRFHGEQWASHTPPRLQGEDGQTLLDRDATDLLGVRLYHYGYCWPRQIAEKRAYHRQGWKEPMLDGGVLKPRPNLVRFRGTHPVKFDL